MIRYFRLILSVALIASAGVVWAQSASLVFGNESHDSSLPVEATSDELSFDQENQTASFSGNVVVIQGDIRLSSDMLKIEYTADNEIDRITATGNVVFVTASEAAEAGLAVYTLAEEKIVMTGNVMATQGNTAISGQRLVVDLASGTGSMEGRVKTILQSGN